MADMFGALIFGQPPGGLAVQVWEHLSPSERKLVLHAAQLGFDLHRHNYVGVAEDARNFLDDLDKVSRQNRRGRSRRR